MRVEFLLVSILIFVLSTVCAGAKSGRWLYTPEMMEAMRDNIAQYDWAKARRDSAVAAGDTIVDTPLQELAGWVPDPRIPRSIYVHETGCPNCGLEMRKYGNYSWIISEDKPYKVTCPNCGKTYPSNDYQAFVDSGFEDRSLLTGEYPDDGWGWQSPEYPDHKYWFVAWYNHWMTQRRLLPAIEKLSQAYLFSNEPKYACKCAVLLWQLAEYYPDYDYVNQSRIGTEFNHSYHGKLFYHTWETSTVKVCADAYDAIFPALQEGCPELEAFADKSSAEICSLIEEQLLRAMARHIVEETMHIAGNYGSHQAGLLKIAAVLQDTPGDPSSQEMIDWLLNNEEYSVYTMMPLYDALYNLIYPDGVPFESPGYNLGWVRNLTTIAELLKLNDVDVFKEPRFKRLYDWPIEIVVAGNFLPALGDSGSPANRGRLWRENIYETAFRQYGDPEYAAVLTELSPHPGRDIFARPITEKVQATAEQMTGPLGYADQHLTGYGLAILQNENPEDAIAATLFYGRFLGHSHHDKMHLDIFAENCSMLPDFGYPETANSTDPRRGGFFAHTISHNTVMVDRSDQSNGRGRCLAYDTGPVCQYVEAENLAVYDQCETYRRAVTMVEADKGTYFVDIFRVSGGTEHDWLLHGTNATVSSSLDFSEPRKEGTLAGPDVEYGYFYDDPKLAEVPYGSANYFTYDGSAFQFLFNVQEAELQPDAWVQWDVITEGPQAVSSIRADEGAFLRAYLVGEDEQVFLCDGRPQQNRKTNPDTVKFCIRRKEGEHLDSTFTTVFEPGDREPFIEEVTPLQTGVPGLVVLRIALKSGATHYIFNAPEAVECSLENGIRFSGRVGMLNVDRSGQVQQAYLYEGTLLAEDDWEINPIDSVRASIEECDFEESTVTLSEPVSEGRTLDGDSAIVLCGDYGAFFTINGTGDDRTLSLGDQSPIVGRAYVTDVKPAEGTLMTTTRMPFVLAGMHVVNEKMEPVGRVKSAPGGGVLALTEPFDEGAFTDADGDGSLRAYVTDCGPGDEIILPSSVRYAPK